jgi:hypothetical protein
VLKRADEERRLHPGCRLGFLAAGLPGASLPPPVPVTCAHSESQTGSAELERHDAEAPPISTYPPRPRPHPFRPCSSRLHRVDRRHPTPTQRPSGRCSWLARPLALPRGKGCIAHSPWSGLLAPLGIKTLEGTTRGYLPALIPGDRHPVRLKAKPGIPSHREDAVPTRTSKEEDSPYDRCLSQS